MGRELARLPVDPRLGRMLLAGSEQGSLEELLTICAGLSIQDPRERPADAQQAADEAHRKLADEKSDFLSYVKLWNWYEKANAEKESNRKLEAELHRRYLSVRRLREWRDVRRQLVQLTDELGWRRNTSPATFEQVHRALLTGLLGNIGSKAVEDPDFMAAMAKKYGSMLAVSIDAKEDVVATRGWVDGSDKRVLPFAQSMLDLGINTLIYTDISRDGMLTGPNFTVLGQLQQLPYIRLIASGGMSSIDDIKKLKAMGIYGAITGKALYEGKITMAEIRSLGGM